MEIKCSITFLIGFCFAFFNLALSDAKEIGVINQEQSHKIEWTIQDIFSYTEENKSFFSPTISVPGSLWCLRIYPNGVRDEDSVGWIGLYLRRSDRSPSPKNVNYDFGVKKPDGTVVTMHSNLSDVFDKKGTSWGFPTYLERSELQKRKSELAPSGSLTVTCTLKVEDALDTTIRLNKLSDDFNGMYMYGEGDVTLKVQNETFLVHKSVLAARSPIFKTMFDVDMAENNTGVVEIVDCHPKAFDDFLLYVYSGKFENSSDEMFELYKIAHVYEVEELESSCVLFIRSQLSVDNVIDVAVFADKFNEEELKHKSQKIFNKYFSEIVFQDKWRALFANNPNLAHDLLKNMMKTMELKEKIPAK